MEVTRDESWYKSKYQYLEITYLEPKIALVTINRPSKANACHIQMHWEFSEIFKDLDSDASINVILVTGKGKNFSGGGDHDMILQMSSDRSVLYRVYEDARALPLNMIHCRKIIISAINGPAVGAGCALALMADITIASENARFNDGHSRLGVAAGDHAAGIWPLLCGMAKAKYYVLTGDWVSAKEAERIGLVSQVWPHEEFFERAKKVAEQVSRGPQWAVRGSKRAMDGLLKQNFVSSFEVSCALEMLHFGDPDVKEGIKAAMEKRAAVFPTAVGRSDTTRGAKL
eukprot:TRINITY_DN18163_c0_g1_i1.p1 TRINITY_DN18163_c0_g1~~TRINITY_DN18163_c0_g1_i1.p1  ORF type:complete len:286 (+),score=47.08 TRINITY_DN18163_c0_g1_i1:244-1101(+)